MPKHQILPGFGQTGKPGRTGGVKQTINTYPQLFSDPGKKREPILGLGPFLVEQPPDKKGKKGATEQLSTFSGLSGTPIQAHCRWIAFPETRVLQLRAMLLDLMGWATSYKPFGRENPTCPSKREESTKKPRGIIPANSV